MENEIPDKNLFMMCRKINMDAFSKLSIEYHIRTCRRNELDLWKAMPFDDMKTAKEYEGFMTDYFNDVYKDRESLFFEKCIFVCNKNDTPVGTCFAWKAYGSITTIHWFKIAKNLEGLGIGRALLSYVLNDIDVKDYPIYLHTQPSSFRAIKLYSDFGFEILTDSVIGSRQNDFAECLPILKTYMLQKDYEELRFAKAPKLFLEAVKSSNIIQF